MKVVITKPYGIGDNVARVPPYVPLVSVFFFLSLINRLEIINLVPFTLVYFDNHSLFTTYVFSLSNYFTVD